MEAASVATYGRVVELVDSLDSGSSVHCGRAGSSPASPTKETVERLSLFLLAGKLYYKYFFLTFS